MSSFNTVADLPKTRIYVRERGGTFVYEGPIVPPADVNGDTSITGYTLQNVSFAVPKNLKFAPIFDPTGTKICYIFEGGKNLTLHSSLDGSKMLELEVSDAQKVEFSPKGNYLITWSSPSKGNAIEAPENNLKIWNVNSGALIASYFQKTFKADHIQWTTDEKYCFRQVTNEIHVYQDDHLLPTDSIGKLRFTGFTQFKIAASGTNPTVIHVAVFTPEGGGKPGKVTLFVCRTHPTVEIEGPGNSRTIFGATEALLLWNKTATTLLVHSQSDVDTSGSSYYGATGLYIMSSVSELSSKVEQTKDGPVHGVQWSPMGDRFVVAAGNMPCQCTMHNEQGTPVFQFGAAHRNVIAFAPHGRFLCLAGFGNLAGEMDFYDLQRLKKLGSNVSHCATNYGWSPDSRFFMTATLAPRMNVDNGFKLFKYNGVGPVLHQPIDRAFEVVWQPVASPSEVFPNRGPSPVRRNADGSVAAPPSSSVTAAAPVKAVAYRPPGSTGSLSEMMKKEKVTTAAPMGKVKAESTTSSSNGAKFVPSSQKRIIPGMAPANAPSQTPKPKSPQPPQQTQQPKKLTVTNNANNNNAKNSTDAAKINAANPVVAPTQPLAAAETAESKEKRAKAIGKKLKQIQELKDKLAAGQTLDSEQRKKLDSEAALRAELVSLN